MKVQTWLPKKRPIARTLADVPSSVDSPVLCWNLKGDAILSMFVSGDSAKILHKDGRYEDSFTGPSKFRLYDQPPRPTKLEDVPDRWVIQASWTFNGKPETFLIFKVDGTWLDLKGEAGFKSYNNPLSWQLTDCIVEFEAVEVEVIG